MGTMSGGAMSDSNPSHLSSVSDMKQHLQTLLDSKEKQLEQAATLGQQVLAQRLELEQRIGQLQAAMNEKADEEDIDSEARRGYRDLTDTLRDWDSENAETSATFGPSSRNANGAPPSPAIRLTDLPREEPDRAKPISTASQSRRAKNAAHRADDVEFAFEIGSGLLTEVRRLQSLLAERDKVIQDMKEEKDDLEKAVESLRNSLRQQEQNADKYKEENWNLEVTLQELRSQLADTQASCLRAEGETKRLTKQLASSHDSSEQQKNDLEKIQTAYGELKAKHETDIAQARKHAAGLQRDKSDLQQSMEALKAEHARANRRLPRLGGSPSASNDAPNDFLTPGGPLDDDLFSMVGSTNRRRVDNSLYAPDRFSDYADSSPDASPIKAPKAPNHPSNEIESLQQRLAHAQRQINTLKNTLQREKELKMDYRRKLGASPGTKDQEEEEDADLFEDETAQSASARRPTPYRQRGSRIRGRGRGRGGLTLSERLGMVASSPASEFPDDEEDAFHFDPSAPPVPAINFGAQSVAEREQTNGEEQPVRSPSPSPFDAPSNRTSIDGMDPAFANVLRRTPSTGSIPHHSSPLRQAVPVRGGTLGRRTRGGAAFQEARPPSLVGQPDVLAAELGFGSPLKSNESIITEVPVEKADFGCQTDPIEEPQTAVPPVDAVKVDSTMQPDSPEAPAMTARSLVESSVQTIESSRNDASIQCTPPPVSTSTTGVSTDPPVVVTTSHTGIQAETPISHDAQSQTPPTPILVDAEVQSEPLQRDADSSLSSSSVTEDTTLTPTLAIASLPDLDSESDGDQTETGMDTDLEPETETDTADFTDARQSVAASTPFQSVDDLHSIVTHTDRSIMRSTPSESMDDFHSIKSYQDDGNDADRDSILTSTAKRLSASSYATSTMSDPPRPPSPTYDSKSITAMIPQPEAPKPELKEMSVQTDEWQPPVRPVVPPSPAFRIGSSGQQFQFVPATNTSSRTTSLNSTAGLLPNLMRDSPAAPHRNLPSDRRQSMDSLVSSMMEEQTPAPVDKTKPPTMMLPPPPRMPPPPSSMPPPSFIPERRDVPPPRPSSPPPPELIQRATTPTFGSVLAIPGARQSRQSGSSMPPSQQGLRELPSTHSFRSASNAANHAGGLFGIVDRERREFSSTSLNSERSVASPRSSFSSEQHFTLRNNLPKPPTTPDRTVTAMNAPGLSTDPAIIHAITQTMIGEPLYKYVRRPMGGNSRHKRFFWVHPYTKMLYWSDSDPQSSKVSESSAKSAYIEGIRSVLDPNPMPPGLYQYSLIVTTRERELKFTPASKERHDIWLNALRYLLSRANPANVMSPANTTILPRSPQSSNGHLDADLGRPRVDSSPQSTRSRPGYRNIDSFNTTPRGTTRSRSQMSVGRRSGTPAMEYLRWNGPESPSKSYEHVQNHDDEDLDFELHGEDTDEGFEGLANVRACCDGRHTVGGHHHHHHPVAGDAPQENLRPQFEGTSRPVSPSAWSFRSRAGSSHSRDTTSMFSWGRAEGKLRFGSKRSRQTVPMPDD